jgi:hypothetical protein
MHRSDDYEENREYMYNAIANNAITRSTLDPIFEDIRGGFAGAMDVRLF